MHVVLAGVAKQSPGLTPAACKHNALEGVGWAKPRTIVECMPNASTTTQTQRVRRTVRRWHRLPNPILLRTLGSSKPRQRLTTRMR